LDFCLGLRQSIDGVGKLLIAYLDVAKMWFDPASAALLSESSQGNPRQIAQYLMLLAIREESAKSSRHLPVIEGLAFPDNQNIPTEPFQLTLLPPISPSVLLEFLCPKCRSGFGICRSRAGLMPVPETAMDEDDFSKSRKD
jgi:hypothetical protein